MKITYDSSVDAAYIILSGIERELSDASSIDSRLKGSADKIKEIRYLLEDIAYSLRDYAERIFYDKERLDEIEERLSLIDSLKRRFGGSIEEILSYRKRIEDEISSGTEYKEEVKRLCEEIPAFQRELNKRADELSKKRREAAARLKSEVEKGLLSLNMRARFDTEFIGTELNERGKERARFLFSANPGEPLRPLSMTASGGELCSNQIAAFADRHFFVKKEIEDKRTVTRVKMLEGKKPPNQLEEEQRGEKRAEYGEYLIRRLAKDLTKQFGKGFTERNLWWMKQFYITTQNCTHCVQNLKKMKNSTHCVHN